MAIRRPASRLVFFCGLAVTVAAAPAVNIAIAPATAMADDCPAGLTLDVYTVQCVPELVPTAGGGVQSPQQNSSVTTSVPPTP